LIPTETEQGSVIKWLNASKNSNVPLPVNNILRLSIITIQLGVSVYFSILENSDDRLLWDSERENAWSFLGSFKEYVLGTAYDGGKLSKVFIV
jgi:hypothetical protein